ncbi:MAG: glutathione S-transferase family protein [Sphingomonadales bacterium]|nr:MAG: glutathione S-transferase family protein [Sphingomonadales bacterium]
MWQLYQFPLCPFSRKVRLLLGEKGVGYELVRRTWLAGATMSLADLTAAAHISVADYLGGIDWTGHEQTKGWYSGLKSRPSFRPLLAERMEIVTPPKYYEDVDF